MQHLPWKYLLVKTSFIFFIIILNKIYAPYFIKYLKITSLFARKTFPAVFFNNNNDNEQCWKRSLRNSQFKPIPIYFRGWSRNNLHILHLFYYNHLSSCNLNNVENSLFRQDTKIIATKSKYQIIWEWVFK